MVTSLLVVYISWSIFVEWYFFLDFLGETCYRRICNNLQNVEVCVGSAWLHVVSVGSQYSSNSNGLVCSIEDAGVLLRIFFVLSKRRDHLVICWSTLLTRKGLEVYQFLLLLVVPLKWVEVENRVVGLWCHYQSMASFQFIMCFISSWLWDEFSNVGSLVLMFGQCLIPMYCAYQLVVVIFLGHWLQERCNSCFGTKFWISGCIIVVRCLAKS